MKFALLTPLAPSKNRRDTVRPAPIPCLEKKATIRPQVKTPIIPLLIFKEGQGVVIPSSLYRNYPFIFLLLIGLCQCQPSLSSQEKKLMGEWKIDSIYQYVNGFSQTKRIPERDWSTFEYLPQGIMAEKREEQQKRYRYRLIAADSLIYTDSTGTLLSGFRILKLDDQRLVLKKIRQPYLSGKNQHLYEIRYFSKMQPDSPTSSARSGP
jgi:hypothetical protein